MLKLTTNPMIVIVKTSPNTLSIVSNFGKLINGKPVGTSPITFTLNVFLKSIKYEIKVPMITTINCIGTGNLQ